MKKNRPQLTIRSTKETQSSNGQNTYRTLPTLGKELSTPKGILVSPVNKGFQSSVVTPFNQRILKKPAGTPHHGNTKDPLSLDMEKFRNEYHLSTESF